MPANDKSDRQFEKSKQKTTTSRHGHRCSRSAFGKVRFLGYLGQRIEKLQAVKVGGFEKDYATLPESSHTHAAQVQVPDVRIRLKV